MRKAILVVALIGASFAGGAVVNGPCLGWAQSYLVHKLGGDAPASAEQNLAAPSIDEIPTVEDSPPGGALPAAPLPPLSPAAPKAEVAATTAPAAAVEPDPVDPPLTGPSAAALEDVPAPPAPTTGASDLALKDDEPEENAWKDAPDSTAPARPVLPARATSNTDPAVVVAIAGPGESGASSWTQMRKRLREAGVARYWIEGEPGGSVRLRCLIPIAGQRAVGQQFEGDGDSESQAAESVLRRIALWKATETP